MTINKMEDICQEGKIRNEENIEKIEVILHQPI